MVPRTLFGIKSSGVDSLDTDPFFIEPPPSWSKGRSPAGKQGKQTVISGQDRCLKEITRGDDYRLARTNQLTTMSTSLSSLPFSIGRLREYFEGTKLIV